MGNIHVFKIHNASVPYSCTYHTAVFLKLNQPGFGLPGRLYYLVPDLEHMRDAYVKLASSVAVLFGAERMTAEQAMKEVLELETELANVKQCRLY